MNARIERLIVVALAGVLICEIILTSVQARIPKEEGGATDMTWVLVSSNYVKLVNLENPRGIIVRVRSGTNYLGIGNASARLIRCAGIRMLFDGPVGHAQTRVMEGEWRLND